MVPTEGQILAGRYRVVRTLGDGVLGAVYEAEDHLRHRPVAIRLLHPHVAERRDALRRFQRAAQAAGRLGSPHLVEVLDAGELEGGAPFLVMELLEGTTLAQRLHDAGRLAPEDAASLALQLLAGLGEAHAAGVIHRDLKPASVFLTSGRGGDFVKVLDFGAAELAAHGDDLGAAGGGPLLGTPFYMSPEQAKGVPHIDRRTDLYAVGVILYECVTGKLPFEAETLNELIFRIVLESPPPIESVVPGLDPTFVAIVRKAMAREIGERFQSAWEMREALVGWLGAAPVPVGQDTGRMLFWAAPPARRHGRDTIERTVVLGLLATVALGGATLFAVRPHHENAPSPPALPTTVVASSPAEAAPAIAPPPSAPSAPSAVAPATSTSARPPKPAATPWRKPLTVTPARRSLPDPR